MKRLDKILCDAGLCSRSEARNYIRRGRVVADGAVQTDFSLKLDEKASSVTLDGIPVRTDAYYYIMMNKPAGVVSATEDPEQKTVVDILPDEYKNLGLFPVGRLDKDTEGLLLLTNDGEWAHKITSPVRLVEKVYLAHIDKDVSEETIEAFRRGIELKDGTVCESAGLRQYGDGKCLVTLTEGKYHQVKRMLASQGIRVLYLERIRLGALDLDRNIPRGGVKELSENEKNFLV